MKKEKQQRVLVVRFDVTDLPRFILADLRAAVEVQGEDLDDFINDRSWDAPLIDSRIERPACRIKAKKRRSR